MKTVPAFAVPVLWLISFFFSIPLVEPYEISRLIAVGAAVAAFGLVLADPANRMALVTLTPFIALVSIFLVWCGLTFFWSVSPFTTVIAWGTLSLLPLWLMIFAVLPLAMSQIMLTLKLAVAMSVALAIWALLQFFLLPEFLTSYGTIRHPFADPNNYAALLNMGLFTALGLAFISPHRRMRWLLQGAAVLMMVALVLIGSRMAMIVTVVSGIVFFALTLKTPGYHHKFWGVFCVAAVLALIASDLHGADRVTSLERTIELLVPAEDASVSARLLIWESSLALLKEYIWIGAGLGSFYLLYPSVRDADENSSAGYMAHSDPLQFGIEAGLPAVIMLYAILVMVLVMFVRYLKITVRDDHMRVLVVGLFCALLTLALHMHVSFHLFIAAPLALAGLLMGVFIRLMPQSKAAVRCRLMPWGVIDLLLLAAFLVVLQSCLFSEMHTRQAVAALDRGDMQAFGGLVNQAGEEGFGLNPRPYILAASVPMGLLQTSTLPADEREKLFRQADALIEKGLARSPLSASAYVARSMLYETMGRSEESRQFLDRALKINPRDAQARLLRGE